MNDRLIDVIQYARDWRLETLQRIKKSEKPLYVYGAGKAAGLRIKWLREYGVKIKGCVVDAQYFEPGMQLEGLEISDIEIVQKQGTEYELFIGFENHKKAKEAVESFGQAGITVYYIEDPFKFRYMDYDFFLKNCDKFQAAYDLLEDELSKKIFVAHLNSKISALSDEISRFCQESPYGYDFDLMHLGENEIFVDCGAFDGDTIEEFVQYTKNRFDRIYAFEPDRNNADRLRNKIDVKNVFVIEKGTGKEKGMARFYADASLFSNFVDSAIWGDETRRDLYGDSEEYIEVPITTLDDELMDVPVSVIKMDIEGSELEALMGAEKIIRRYHPKLAVCVYHKQEDLFAIIHYIHTFDETGTRYKYYLRHHSDDVTETVLYALPV